MEAVFHGVHYIKMHPSATKLFMQYSLWQNGTIHLGLAHASKVVCTACKIASQEFPSKFNDIAHLADLMGHESIETTSIYLHRTATAQRDLTNRIVTR